MKAIANRPSGSGRRAALGLGLACVLACVSWPASAGAYDDFFLAVAVDNAHGVDKLLARGFDVNSRDEKGQPAMLLAMREASFKVAEVLIRHPDFDVNALNFTRENALMMAALQGHTDWVRRLLDRGAQIEKTSYTPLHYAATGPESATVSLLLQRGAKVDSRASNGNTPLMMAARYGSEGSVAELLRHGADAKARNERDQTAADMARSAGRDSLAQMIEQYRPAATR